MFKKIPIFNIAIGFLCAFTFRWENDWNFVNGSLNNEKIKSFALCRLPEVDLLSRPYTLISNLFIHSSPEHIFNNLFYLCVCGFFVELVAVNFFVNIVIFIAAILATTADLLVPGCYVGISGYTKALQGVAFIYAIRQLIENASSLPNSQKAMSTPTGKVPNNEIYPKDIFKNKIALVLVSIVILIFVAGETLPAEKRAMDKVGNYAHIAGLLVGLIIGAVTVIKKIDGKILKKYLSFFVIFIIALNLLAFFF